MSELSQRLRQTASEAADRIEALEAALKPPTNPNDSGVHAPPVGGSFDYNAYTGPAVGGSYIDPVFGSTVRRITGDNNGDDIYGRNSYWNADGTKYLHRTSSAGPNSSWQDVYTIVNVITGVITHNKIPRVDVGATAPDVSFDPINPNVFYQLSGANVLAHLLSSDGTWSTSTYFTAPSPLKPLGGTLNWLSPDGKYMLLHYGTAEPSVYVYDRANLGLGPYIPGLDGSLTIGQNHYIGFTPDSKYLLGYTQYPGNTGGVWPGRGACCWPLNHTTRMIGARNVYWELGGDHQFPISTSDGHNYVVIANAYDSYTTPWRVNITNNATGLTVAQQKALPGNIQLIPTPISNTGDGDFHVSGVARGPLRDWAFLSSEVNHDLFNTPPTNWQPYESEIFAINLVTLEVRRLAHHRSRSVSANYLNYPRVSATWTGNYVGWSSNFNQQNAWNIYVLAFS